MPHWMRKSTAMALPNTFPMMASYALLRAPNSRDNLFGAHHYLRARDTPLRPVLIAHVRKKSQTRQNQQSDQQKSPGGHGGPFSVSTSRCVPVAVCEVPLDPVASLPLRNSHITQDTGIMTMALCVHLPLSV